MSHKKVDLKVFFWKFIVFLKWLLQDMIISILQKNFRKQSLLTLKNLPV